MPSSAKRRRQRLDPIRRVRRAAVRELRDTAREEGRELDPEQRRRLVNAATEFADPYVCRDRDALLPAHRWDLRRKFFRRAMRSGANSMSEYIAIARELAPLPDEPAPAGIRPFGVNVEPASYRETLRAFEWLHSHPRTERQEVRSTKSA